MLAELYTRKYDSSIHAEARGNFDGSDSEGAGGVGGRNDEWIGTRKMLFLQEHHTEFMGNNQD